MSESREKTNRIQVRLGDGLFEYVTYKAERTHRSKGQFIEHCVALYMRDYPVKK